MYRNNSTALGAYAVSQTIFVACADIDGVSRREESGGHPTGFAAYDSSGTTWPVSAEQAAAILARKASKAPDVEF